MGGIGDHQQGGQMARDYFFYQKGARHPLLCWDDRRGERWSPKSKPLSFLLSSTAGIMVVCWGIVVMLCKQMAHHKTGGTTQWGITSCGLKNHDVCCPWMETKAWGGRRASGPSVPMRVGVAVTSTIVRLPLLLLTSPKQDSFCKRDEWILNGFFE